MQYKTNNINEQPHKKFKVWLAIYQSIKQMVLTNNECEACWHWQAKLPSVAFVKQTCWSKSGKSEHFENMETT